MSDESPRSTPGNAPQRGSNGAPAWWSELDRIDLPRDGAERAGPPALASPPIAAEVERCPTPPAPAAAGPRPPLRAERLTGVAARRGGEHRRSPLRGLASTVAVVLAALCVAWFGVGGGDGRSVLVVVVVFGVPVALTAAVVAVVARRSS